MRDAQLAAAAKALRQLFGEELFNDHNHCRGEVQNALKLQGLKLSAVDLKLLLKQVSWREETAPPVIAKVHKLGRVAADPAAGGGRHRSLPAERSAGLHPRCLAQPGGHQGGL
jgi:type I restriction enzyme M protein